MKQELKAKDLLEIHPDSSKAKELEKKLDNFIVVEKSFFRITNQAFFVGLFFLILGLYTLKAFPDAKISEGFGGISIYGLFIASGIVLISWFKMGEILKVLGEFISKVKSGGNT
ncbi:hypothetical protein [Leptospira noguchii]|nr:hypothetical protein [Leptospira noguchii]EKR71641.1 hypothetical protein LEP1GSC041_0779 [Leptospira noguchii str. 2006001870]EMO42627.1 hypothetical protein LEP1GSC186_0786 [Leptospira noguchii serovar Autumnalis str. ZUN142]EMS88800.1 hypothetical protein LEP1GSC074_0964 [Leptospira noguchii str. Hook]MCH1913864.1 hypothetical protein [Leptospira noguchii]MCH1917609.1 hypothetical protein [Leptospira noguchii]